MYHLAWCKGEIKMQHLGKQVLFMITGLTVALGIQSQTIYRCGNVYSQTPCPDGIPLNLNDRREPHQKQQTDAAADQAARLARAMEHTRIAEEKRLLAGERTSLPTAPEKAVPSTGNSTYGTVLTPKRVQPKHKKPEAFIAEVPGSEKSAVQKKK